MKDELISFQTAILAKEKGFNERVENYSNITEPDRIITTGAFNYNYKAHGNTTVSLPTQSLLQRWIRETQSIDLYVVKFSRWKYAFFVNLRYKGGYDTYEEALEDGIMVALNMIK